MCVVGLKNRGRIGFRRRTMKQLLLAGMLCVSALLPLVARAQDEGGEAPTGDAPQTRFYDFNDMLIDGEFMRPEGMFTRARDRARFERLLELRREFMEEIDESAKDSALE